MTTRLLLVRHGQTEFNAQGIYQGQADSPLTVEGVSQAGMLAPRIRGLPTSPSFYCSDLGRARHTAELIADPARHALVEDPGLRERDYGIFQGMRKAEIPGRFPDAWARYRSGDPDYALPEGESLRAFVERVVTTVDGIADAHPGELVVAVTHGGVLTALAKQVLGLAIDAPRRFDIGNTSVNLFSRDEEGRWLILSLGDLGHLPQLPEPNQTEG